ncbi:MAG: DUF4340 domain-containing protein [Verrucomicrobiia bacterium]|jgi:hypothetical protein
MNSKQFVKILIFVLVIGGVGLLVKKSRQGDWKEVSGGAGDKVLGEFDINEVSGLTIRNSAGELNVIKQDGRWVVKQRGGYAAKFSSVFDFMRKVDELTVVQKEQIGETQFGRMEVNEPGADSGAGTLVDLQDAEGKSLKKLILGKEQMKKGDASSPFGAGEVAVGRWVLNPDDKENILLTSETFSDAGIEAKDWVSKDFFGIAKLKAIDVVSSSNEFSWKVVREKEGGDWQLQGLKKDEATEASKLSSIGNPLGSPSFQDVVVDQKDEETGLDKPTKVTLTTFDGFQYDVKVGKQTSDNDYYFQVSASAKIEKTRTPGKDEKEEDKAKLDTDFAAAATKLEEKLAKEQVFNKWTYLVSKWTVDSFFKPRAEFIAEEKEEKIDDAAVSIPGFPTPLLPPLAPSAGNIDIKKMLAKPPVVSTPKPPVVKPPTPKKPAAKKAAPKPVTPKPVTKKPAVKKPVAKQPAPKAAAKKPVAAEKKVSKPTAPAAKKAPEAKKDN